MTGYEATAPGKDVSLAHPRGPRARISVLAALSHGPWFQHPYICIPATCDEGELRILVGVAHWQSALAASDGDVPAAMKLIFHQASDRARWAFHDGEPALMLTD